MKALIAVSKQELRLLRADPFPIVLLIGMPLVLMVFFARATVGGPGSSIPGLTALFGFFGLSVVGMAFFRDYAWFTWDRLRLSPVRAVEVVVGKVAPYSLVLLLQQMLLLFFGWALFQMPWRGSLAAGALLIVATSAVETAAGLLIATYCHTMNQFFAISNLGALLLAGLAGSISPVSELPKWLQRIAPASPAYWSLRGIRAVTLGNATWPNLAVDICILCAYAMVCVLLTIAHFRLSDSKTYYA